MERNSELQQLFRKYITGSINHPEFQLLLTYFEEAPDQLDELIMQQMEQDPVDVDQAELQNTLLKVDLALKNKVKSKPQKTVGLRKLYPYVAAALILIVGMLIYTYQSDQNQDSVRTAQVEIKDIKPGTNKATITMPDGTIYTLREDSDGIATDEHGIRYGDGNLIVTTDKVISLELATPKGGKYNAVLPDGTRVWLNAESSITYPSQFDKHMRYVKVAGEVFFEVAKDHKRKFVVEIERGGHIEVLGTHFNINAYPDLDYIRTTLLEGSVRVFDRESNVLELKPGQQVSQGTGKMWVRTIDTDIVTAWKKDIFNFEGLGFREVMGQLERWYDIEVIYESTTPKFGFYGELSRNNSLQDILEAFADSGIKTRLQGRKLYIN